MSSPAAQAESESGRRFLADRMLWRLARWLRVAGEDVLAPARPGSHEPTRDQLLDLARTESRVVLTRDRSFPGLRSDRLLIVSTDLDEQLREFYHAFPGDPLARVFTRCTACNGQAAEVERETVLARLPPAVRAHGRGFRCCRKCGQIYWDGSHSRAIRKRLTEVQQALAAAPSEGMGRSGAAGPVPVLAPDDHSGWVRFDDFLRLLFARLDLSWSGYRRPRRSLRTPIVERMRELGIRDYGEYLEHLEAHFAEEEGALAPILAITISRFFRDREDWVHLAGLAFPELARHDRPLRAASLGCASGEEPYSLRLLWNDAASVGLSPPPLEIDAFDVREDLLDRALKAIYPASSIHSVPAPFRRHFIPEDGSYRLERAIVTSVGFSRLDLFRDTIPGPFALILCRNLAFTYLGEGRRGVFARRLLAALAPGGFLMIGGGERLPPELGEKIHRLGRCLYAI